MEFHAAASHRPRQRRPAPDKMERHATTWGFRGAASGSAFRSIAFRRIHTPAQPQLCQILAILAPPVARAISRRRSSPEPPNRAREGKVRDGSGNGRGRRRAAQKSGGRTWQGERPVGHWKAWNSMRRRRIARDSADLHRTRWSGMRLLGDSAELHRAALSVQLHSVASTLPHNLNSPKFLQSWRLLPRFEFHADDPHPNRRIQQGRGRGGKGREGKWEREGAPESSTEHLGRDGGEMNSPWGTTEHGSAWSGMGRHGNVTARHRTGRTCSRPQRIARDCTGMARGRGYLHRTAGNCAAHRGRAGNCGEPHETASRDVGQRFPIPSHSLAYTLPHNLSCAKFLQSSRLRPRWQFPADDPHTKRRIQQAK
jgi:hypothetical protein